MTNSHDDAAPGGTDEGDHPTPIAADALAGRRILLTGATGFIGGHVADRLTRAGAEVHGLARSASPVTTLGTSLRWHQADLTDAAATDAAVAAASPDQIIHLASLVKGARDPDLILPMFMANAASTVHLLEAARRHGVERIHLAGSLEEPDDVDTVPTSPYAASKATSHLYGDYYDHTTDVDVVNLQIFMVYGPAQVDESKLIPYVINTLLDGDTPRIGSGTRPVDWVHVDDVAEAIVRCCMVTPHPAQPVPVGTGALHTVSDVVERLVRLAEAAAPVSTGAVPDRTDEMVKRADVDLTEKLIGWRPGIDLDQGLAQTLLWYRQRRDNH